MTDAAQRLFAAEAAAVAQRERTQATLAEVKQRLQPRRLARVALVEATVAGESAAIAGARTARRYPGALVGIVALAGLFLARHRIAELFGRTPDRIDVNGER